MKKLMVAAFAAVAMVGAANAAKDYNIIANNYVSSYDAYDTNPGAEHAGRYSCYVMKQEDAQAAMGVKESVTYSDVADWLGANFADNKASVIENAQQIGYYTCSTGALVPYDNFLLEGEAGLSSGLESAIGVFFYDDGDNVAYNVMANADEYGETFIFDYSLSASSGWQAATVPEPTSGLLLLLGMAGLALKRKRA